MVAGAMLVGSFLGAGIASTVPSDINADIEDIRNPTEQQPSAVDALSDARLSPTS